jgi:Flp pilus assembly protein CpaB
MLCAVSAASGAALIADRYGSSVAGGYGPLRPVVVVEHELREGRPLGPEEITAALTVRRVPERFVPAGALASPTEALGLAPTSTLPGGSYLLAASLALPRRDTDRNPLLAGGRGPVVIAVSGAEALRPAGGMPTGARVDVVVTGEVNSSGGGRTYVAAEDVPLLALRPSPEGAATTATATLGLTRPQALRLIEAQSYARSITLLAGGGG